MIIYHAGHFQTETIALPVHGPAFKFGTGLYETILFNTTAPCRLDLHMKRMHASLDYFGVACPHFEAAPVVAELVRLNRLQGSRARVNVYALMESDANSAVFAASAVPYAYNPDAALSLHPCLHPWTGPLTEHKCMNGMFLALAAREAAQAGCDDALLMDIEGNILETNRTSLLFSDGKTFFAPPKQGRLPSTGTKIAAEILRIETRKITLDDLKNIKHVYALNALMGMKPVIRISDMEFEPDTTTCEHVTMEIHRPDSV